MAFKLAECFIELKAKGMEGVSASINGLRGNLDHLGRVNFAGPVTSGMGRIQSAMSGLKAAAGGLPITIAAVGAGAFALGKHAVGLAMDAEQMATSFKVMLGSAAASKKLMSELQDFAAATPFEMPEVSAAARSLLAFGSTAKGVIDEVRTLGDISSGVAMPIGELAQIYGKARVQGRLFAEDINQLTGRGVPIIAEIAKQLQISESEVRKAVEKGNVNFSNIEQAFKSLTAEGGRFHGMMEEQSKTMAGIASTAKDDLNASLRETGKIIGTAIVPALAEAATLAKDISKLVLPGEASEGREGPSVMDIHDSSKSDLKAMEANAAKAREQKAAALQAAREAAVEHGLNARKMAPVSGAIYGTIQRGFDDKKIAEAEQALQEVDSELSMIRNQMRFAKDEGQKAMTDGIEKPASSATRVVTTMKDAINEYVKLLARDKGAFERAFGGGKQVKEGELGFVQNKVAIDQAAKAAQNYEKQIAKLERQLRTGVIDQPNFDKQKSQAKDAKDAAEAAVHAPQYRTGKQLESAAKSDFQKEIDRIGTLRKLNAMTADEAKAAGDKARSTLQKHLADIQKMEAKARHTSLADQFEATKQKVKDKAKAFMAGEQHKNPLADKVSAEAKKIGEQFRTPMEEYEHRMKELNKLRDNDGFKGHEQDYKRAAHAAKKDLDAALGAGDYRPQFRTKKGQLAEEERRYKKELADLEDQGLDKDTKAHKRGLLDFGHRNRLADIDEQHDKNPHVQMHGLTDFAKHIQQAMTEKKTDAVRERREVEMHDYLRNIDIKIGQIKSGPARFGKGP